MRGDSSMAQEWDVCNGIGVVERASSPWECGRPRPGRQYDLLMRRLFQQLGEQDGALRWSALAPAFHMIAEDCQIAAHGFVSGCPSGKLVIHPHQKFRHDAAVQRADLVERAGVVCQRGVKACPVLIKGAVGHGQNFRQQGRAVSLRMPCTGGQGLALVFQCDLTVGRVPGSFHHGDAVVFLQRGTELPQTRSDAAVAVNGVVGSQRQQAIHFFQQMAGIWRRGRRTLFPDGIPGGGQSRRAIAAGCIDASQDGAEAQILRLGRAVGKEEGVFFPASGHDGGGIGKIGAAFAHKASG